MKIKWIKHKDGKTQTVNITQAVQSVSWGGSVSQAARTAELSVINAPYDKNIKKLKLKISAGDVIELHEKNNLIFLGEVITKEKKGETGTVTYSCMDLLNHLLRSTGTYNLSDTTAEAITRKLCSDFKIVTGSIEETKTPIHKMIIDGSCIYDMIMMAYTKAAAQTGKKYICRMEGKKLSVRKKGIVVKNYVLDEKRNMTDSSQQESIENMVNVVKIYDDTGNQIGEVKKDSWVKRYGIYQSVYKKEEGVNETLAAANMLAGVEKKVTVDGINGNLKCIAGNGVKVHDRTTGLNGLFWIDSDTHTWENGIHTMSLELNFQNLMDSKEYEETEEEDEA